MMFMSVLDSVDNMLSMEMMCAFLLLNCRNVDNFFDGHRHSLNEMICSTVWCEIILGMWTT